MKDNSDEKWLKLLQNKWQNWEIFVSFKDLYLKVKAEKENIWIIFILSYVKLL